MSCEAHALAVSRRFLDWDDVDLIRELTKALPANATVVDLGVGSGTTAGAVFAERRDVFVTSFDIVLENLYSAQQFLTNIGAVDHWSYHLGDSVEAAELFPAGDVDLVMIDTSHEYELTVRELAAWRPKVRADGRIWCHDYRGLYPGCAQAIDEAVARGEFVIEAVRGLGCVLRLSDADVLMATLSPWRHPSIGLSDVEPG